MTFAQNDNYKNDETFTSLCAMIVKPFRGYVPPQEEINHVIAPPYDVMNRAEALDIGTARPKSIIHITRPEIRHPSHVEPTEEVVYKTGADLLREWVEKNLLVKSDKPAFYVYRQVLGEHVQIGVFALSSCQQYKDGLIKKHEHTRAAPEKDRTITVRVQNANVGCVFLAYRGDRNAELRDYIRSLATGKPDRVAHLDFDNTDHELWIIDDDARVKRIEELFSKVECMYIADGHHRAASAYNVWEERKAEAGASYTGNEPFCSFMTCIFAESELCVIDYNRIVKGLKTPTPEFLDQLRGAGFEINEMTGQEKPPTPNFLPFHYARCTERHVFSLFLRGKWYRMKFVGKPLSNSPVDNLDSKILTDFVLTPIFHITDLRTDPNISFCGGTRGLAALEKACTDDEHLAFAVPPIQMHELFDVSDSGAMMPPKSTWFVPKLADAMVIRFIE